MNVDKPSDEDKQSIESNKWVKSKHVDYLFVLNNYGKCCKFLTEILQTVGIIPAEHSLIRDISIRKTKWESRCGHYSAIIYGLVHIRFFLKAKSTLARILLAICYPIFCFDMSYSFGRNFGNFIFMPYHLNSFLELRNGNSIHSIQTHLFIKRCVYDNILIKNKKAKQEYWVNSYIFNQICGTSLKKISKFRNKVEDYIKKIY